MSTHIKHDLCVAVDKYTVAGQEKTRWQKVGVELETEQGGRFILLERWFNPAGIPDDGRGSVMLSKFDPKEAHGEARSGQDDNRPARASANATATPPAKSQQVPTVDDFMDDIPF
jgi:hypothetical protein